MTYHLPKVTYFLYLPIKYAVVRTNIKLNNKYLLHSHTDCSIIVAQYFKNTFGFDSLHIEEGPMINYKTNTY